MTPEELQKTYMRSYDGRYDMRRMAQEILGMDESAFLNAVLDWRPVDWENADPRMGLAARHNHEMAGRDPQVRAQRKDTAKYVQECLDDFLSGKEQRRIFARMLISSGLIEAEYGDSEDSLPTSWQLVSLTDDYGNVYTDIREQRS